MYFSKNLKHLRRKNDRQTQDSLAKSLDLTRSVISSYEDGRAEPSVSTLIGISKYFGVSIENLTNLDLSNVDEKKVEFQRQLQKYASANHLYVQKVVADEVHQPLINLVPMKASAGYTSGFANVEYIKDLPTYRLPFLDKTKTYRAFEISGDSMLPLQDKSIVIGEYIEDIQDIKDGQVCVLVCKTEGIVLKKVFNKVEGRGKVLLKSTNLAYSPYEIDIQEVLEIWKFTAFISKDFPTDYDSNQDLREAFTRIETEMQEIKMTQENF
jgi:transcriptional regulator with XRE-family HTH domain